MPNWTPTSLTLGGVRSSSESDQEVPFLVIWYLRGYYEEGPPAVAGGPFREAQKEARTPSCPDRGICREVPRPKLALVRFVEMNP